MTSDDRSSWWRHLPWGAIAAGTAAVLLLIALVPPLRSLATNVARSGNAVVVRGHQCRRSGNLVHLA
jgi:hypothetical protein